MSGGLEVVRHLEAGLDAERRRRRAGRRRQPAQLDAALGARAIGERACRAARTSSSAMPSALGGEPQRLGAQLARGERDGAAAHHGGAARERPDAVLDARGVAADDADVLRRDAELVGGDLGQRGLEPLALRRHAGERR